MAVPTTLSGAEMTRIHRRARGADQRAPTVRARVVVNDPELSASQPLAELAASALNALGHAVEGPCTPLANPVATLAAHDGARLLARSLGDAPDRDGLALGALLAGYVIDSTGYGLHHVLSQTLVRLAGASHGQANAVMLSHTIGALAWRFPERIEALGVALEGDPAEVAARMCTLVGATRLRDLGVEHDVLARVRGGGRRAARARPHPAARRPRGAAGTLRGGMVSDGLKAAEEKMREAGVPDAADRHLRALLRAARVGRVGDARRRRPRAALRRPRPTTTCPRRRTARRSTRRSSIKLNGGLGTSMGMERAKSLLEVKDGQDLPRHHRRAGARAAQAHRRAAAARAHELLLHARGHAGGARAAPRARLRRAAPTSSRTRSRRSRSRTASRSSGPTSPTSSGARRGTATSTRR